MLGVDYPVLARMEEAGKVLPCKSSCSYRMLATATFGTSDICCRHSPAYSTSECKWNKLNQVWTSSTTSSCLNERRQSLLEDICRYNSNRYCCIPHLCHNVCSKTWRGNQQTWLYLKINKAFCLSQNVQRSHVTTQLRLHHAHVKRKWYTART